MKIFLHSCGVPICPRADERAGQLCVVLSSPAAVMAVRSQLVTIARKIWSNSPHHGARIVAMALNNPSLYQEWSVVSSGQ